MRIEGPTPAGGDYAIVRYEDADGNEVSAADAVRSTATEYDPDGAILAETIFDLAKG